MAHSETAGNTIPSKSINQKPNKHNISFGAYWFCPFFAFQIPNIKRLIYAKICFYNCFLLFVVFLRNPLWAYFHLKSQLSIPI